MPEPVPPAARLSPLSACSCVPFNVCDGLHRWFAPVRRYDHILSCVIAVVNTLLKYHVGAFVTGERALQPGRVSYRFFIGVHPGVHWEVLPWPSHSSRATDAPLCAVLVPPPRPGQGVRPVQRKAAPEPAAPGAGCPTGVGRCCDVVALESPTSVGTRGSKVTPPGAVSPLSATRSFLISYPPV